MEQQTKTQNSKFIDSKKTKEEIMEEIKKELSDKYKPSKFIYQSMYNERKWLKQHGKQMYIQFDDSEITELRKYFNSLDNDGSQAIGADELEDPLIALGLAANREEVEKLIDSVDEDGSGQIEFNEFISIMNSVKSEKEAESAIYLFFKRMISGQLIEQMDSNLPFKLNVSQFRRKKILDAIMCQDQNQVKRKETGNKILNAFKKQLINQKQKNKISKGENPNDLSLDQIPNKDEVNTRNGFNIAKMQRFVKGDNNILVKPKSLQIQTNIKK